MAKKIDSNSQLPSSIPTPGGRIAKPSSEFYSIFSPEEVLGIIDALEFGEKCLSSILIKVEALKFGIIFI
jgi:hypothetical protein